MLAHQKKFQRLYFCGFNTIFDRNPGETRVKEGSVQVSGEEASDMELKQEGTDQFDRENGPIPQHRNEPIIGNAEPAGG